MRLRMQKNKVVICMLCLIVCGVFAFITLHNSSENPDYGALVTGLTAIIAAFAVFIQIKDSKDLATGEFLLNLQQEFGSNNYGTEIFMKCWKEYKNEGKVIVENTDKKAIINYLTFFESLYLMLKKDVITIELLDELFGRRFFVVVNNIHVQTMELSTNYEFYLNIYRLHAIWYKYRENNCEDLFCGENENTRDLKMVLEEKIKSEKIKEMKYSKTVKRNLTKIHKYY